MTASNALLVCAAPEPRPPRPNPGCGPQMGRQLAHQLGRYKMIFIVMFLKKVLSLSSLGVKWYCDLHGDLSLF